MIKKSEETQYLVSECHKTSTHTHYCNVMAKLSLTNLIISFIIFYAFNPQTRSFGTWNTLYLDQMDSLDG